MCFVQRTLKRGSGRFYDVNKRDNVSRLKLDVTLEASSVLYLHLSYQVDEEDEMKILIRQLIKTAHKVTVSPSYDNSSTKSYILGAYFYICIRLTFCALYARKTYFTSSITPHHHFMDTHVEFFEHLSLVRQISTGGSPTLVECRECSKTEARNSIK
jgi:hypothetical protein